MNEEQINARKKLMDLYIASFVQKRADINEQLEKVGRQYKNNETPDYDELRMTAHKIAGSAGSYGFKEIGSKAAYLDRLLLAGEPEFNEVETASISLLDGLKNEISS